MDKIAFNVPFITGKELDYIKDAVEKLGHISGNGDYTRKCQKWFEDSYNFGKCLLNVCNVNVAVSLWQLRFKYAP